MQASRSTQSACAAAMNEDHGFIFAAVEDFHARKLANEAPNQGIGTLQHHPNS